MQSRKIWPAVGGGIVVASRKKKVAYSAIHFNFSFWPPRPMDFSLHPRLSCFENYLSRTPPASS